MLWLVRTEKNEILGPMEKQGVLELISQGRIGPRDEVCRANHYWFYLEDQDEVASQLGKVTIKAPPVARADEEEITETDTLAPPGALDEFPELEEAPPEDTALLSNRALRHFQPRHGGPAEKPASSAPSAPAAAPSGPHSGAAPSKPLNLAKAVHPPAAPMTYQPYVLGGVERTSVWRGLASLLMILTVTLIVLVVWILKTSG